jgi:pilus assembly protein Flp/PilA
MKRTIRMFCRMRIWKDTRGQDLIEYALMAGFVAVAAGAIMPGIATKIRSIFSSVDTRLSESIAADSSGTYSLSHRPACRFQLLNRHRPAEQRRPLPRRTSCPAELRRPGASGGESRDSPDSVHFTPMVLSTCKL